MKVSGEFDLWATERYALFTQRGSKMLKGVVEHPKWSLAELEVLELKDEFSGRLGRDLPLGAFIGSAYVPQIDVRFRPFRSEPLISDR